MEMSGKAMPVPSWKLQDGEEDDDEEEERVSKKRRKAAVASAGAGSSSLAQKLLAEAAAFQGTAPADSGAGEVGDEGGPGRDVIRSTSASKVDNSISCRSVDNFERDKKMGQGQYGAVYRAKDKETGEFVALKKVFMEREREGFPMTSLREMNILLAIDHPYIVRVREICVGSDLNSIFMVMELLDHDVRSVLDHQKQPFSQAECKTLMTQLLSGVEHLHDNWVLHRDLKTSNLLYDRGILKICDFGLARQYGSPLTDYTVPVVTLYYRSIELLLGTRRYSTPADVWSVGCIFGELLLRKPLIQGTNEVDQVDKICKLLGAPTDDEWPGMLDLPDAKLLGRGKLGSKNRLRNSFEIGAASWKAAASKPALAESGLALMAAMLVHNPDERMSAADALMHPWFKESPLPQNHDWMPSYPKEIKDSLG